MWLKKETGHWLPLAMTSKAQPRQSGLKLHSMNCTRLVQEKLTRHTCVGHTVSSLGLKPIARNSQDMQISSSFYFSYTSQSSCVRAYLYLQSKRIVLIIFWDHGMLIYLIPKIWMIKSQNLTIGFPLLTNCPLSPQSRQRLHAAESRWTPRPPSLPSSHPSHHFSEPALQTAWQHVWAAGSVLGYVDKCTPWFHFL